MYIYIYIYIYIQSYIQYYIGLYRYIPISLHAPTSPGPVCGSPNMGWGWAGCGGGIPYCYIFMLDIAYWISIHICGYIM